MGITRDLEAKHLGLIHIDRPIYETDRGIHLLMAYGDRIVRVFVERAAIVGESGDPGEPCAALFERNRGHFELLAREKFRVDSQRASVTIKEIVESGA